MIKIIIQNSNYNDIRKNRKSLNIKKCFVSEKKELYLKKIKFY